MSKPAGVTECTAAGAAKVRANALLRSLRPRNQRLVSQRSRMGYKKAGRYAVCIVLVNVKMRDGIGFEFELFPEATVLAKAPQDSEHLIVVPKRVDIHANNVRLRAITALCWRCCRATRQQAP